MQAASSIPPTEGWPPCDAVGREQLHGLTWLTFIRAIPGLAGRFDKEVPAEFWSVDSFAGDRPIAVVSCPCGEEPLVDLARVTECECGRFFLFLGGRIKVAKPPDFE